MLPHDKVFDDLYITNSSFYQLCYFFVKYIPSHILKRKVWDLNKFDIQKHPVLDLDLNVLEHVRYNLYQLQNET